MNCETCGKKIKHREPNKMRRNKRHFCNRACYEAWWKVNIGRAGDTHPTAKPKYTVICKTCGMEFRVSPYRKDTAKFCSHSCRAKHYFTGSRNPLWNGGVTDEHSRVRRLDAYREWRAAVYRRDKWTCRTCGYKGRAIVAHHIKRFADHPALRFALSNGITLCRTCHAHIENPQRLIRQTPEKVKIESEPHGDMRRAAEMTVPLG